MAQTDIAHKQDTDDAALLIAHDNRIATLTLNRPAARNALSLDLIGALQSALDDIAADKNVAVAIIKSTGHVFSAGHDLKEMTAHRGDEDKGRAFFTQVMENCSRMMQTIIRCPKPVIAQIDGVATAAGCQLVASCDLAVASDQSRFCTPGVNIGLFCSTPMVALSRNVSRKQAMEMLLLGELIGAQKAYELGLVNRVVPSTQVADEATQMALAIAAKSRGTVAIGKEAFYRQIEMPLDDAYDYASQTMVKNMLAADAEEGICAFMEKRKPKW